jgi:hypothetical protein
LGAATPVAAGSRDLGLGSTYAALEQPALRSTVWFKDFVATASRRPDGAVEATLAGDDGFVVATLELGGDDVLRLKTRQTGEPEWFGSTEIFLDGDAAPVLDWINLQLYSWWQEAEDLRTAPEHGKALRGSPGDAVLDEGFFRPGPSSRFRPNAGHAVTTMLAAELEYRDEIARGFQTDSGFVTYLWEKTVPNRRTRSGPSGGGERLLAALAWQEDPQVLSFSAGDSELERQQVLQFRATDFPRGFFPFQPSLPWANVQIRHLWTARMSQSFEKNTPGCDGLHWVDGSTLRQCCDQHDKCYSAGNMFTGAPCTASSWFWPFCADTPGCTWSCQACNITAVACFAANLVFIQPNMWRWSWQPYCHITYPGAYCPASCAWCS